MRRSLLALLSPLLSLLITVGPGSPLVPASTADQASPPVVLLVANTGGVGATVRDAPGAAAGHVLAVWPDGTEMLASGVIEETEGRLWSLVRAPDGTDGWLAAELLTVQQDATMPPEPILQ
jgi:hypothetical protein